MGRTRPLSGRRWPPGTPADAMTFFASIGVECAAREDGKVYPLPAQAAAVLDCLRLEAAALGVEERCGAAVRDIRPEGGGFLLTLPDGQVRARRVLVCCGGAASPPSAAPLTATAC